MDRLCNEIVCMIVEQSEGRLAPLATISRRWQEPVERRLFREMTLHAKEKKYLERSTKWCSKRKLPEPELTTDDEDDWGDEDSDEEEPEDEEADGKAGANHAARDNKTREMVEITITQFDSFKHVFEGKNNYRQKYLRRLWFAVTVPYRGGYLMDVKEDERNQEVLREAMQDLFCILVGWRHCKNLELRLIAQEKKQTRGSRRARVMPADPVDWETRLGLKFSEIRPEIPFITSFGYADNAPTRIWPHRACDLVKKFPNLQDLQLLFDDFEDPKDHECRPHPSFSPPIDCFMLIMHYFQIAEASTVAI